MALVTMLSIVATIASLVSADDYKYTWKSSLTITAVDGVQLKADAFVPVPKVANETFPVIIFPNSWGVPQIEYIVRALNLAERGYVALEYATRGWYISGGEIDTAGPLDRSDGSSMIDFVAANRVDWNADMSKVAFMGISYGAGISLMMAGHDPRVTTALALSGWNNITYMLYGNESPNLDEGHSLLNSAKKHGKINASLEEMFDDLLQHKNMTFLMDFANLRSPEMFLSTLNARNVPLFLSSNYMDRLFRPQYMMDFFDKLTVPKFMLLNQGGHAFPEAIGLVLHDNYIWSKAYLWLDQWLKGNNTGILSEPNQQMQLGTSVASTTYIPYSQATKQRMQLFLTPRGNSTGGLAPAAPAASLEKTALQFTKVASLDSCKKDDTMQAFGLPCTENLAQPQNVAAVYQSEPLTADINLCGVPLLNFTFKATANDWQFYPTLFDVAPGATSGRLISFGFYTHYESGPTAGPAAQRNSDGSWTVNGAQLHTVCQTIPSGHSIALGVKLYSPMMGPANTDASLSLFMNYGLSSLILPVATWA